MLGDGCLSLVYGKKKFISIAGSIHDDLPFFKEKLKPIIDNLTSRDISIKFKPSQGSLEFNFINNELYDFIARFGFPIGKKGDKLFTPKIFYEKNLVKYLVCGFFATDGSLVLTKNNGTLYPRIEANGIAKKLIKEIHDFIISKGINSNLYEAKRKDKTYFERYNPQYRIQINGDKNLRKFVKEFGFSNPKHIEKLNHYNLQSGCTGN